MLYDFSIIRYPNMNSITLTAFNRPACLRKTIDSLKINDLSGYDKLYCGVEPGNSEVVEILRAIDFIDTRIILNPRILGVRKNPFALLERVFEEGAEFNVYIEDDQLLSPDAFDVFNYHRRVLGSQPKMLCTCLYNPASSNIYPNRLIKSFDFVAIGFSLTKSQWLDYFKPYWFDEALNQEMGGTAEGWDWCIRALMKKYHLHSVIPALSRSYHLGQTGTHCTPAEYEKSFRHHPMAQYKGDALYLADHQRHSAETARDRKGDNHLDKTHNTLLLNALGIQAPWRLLDQYLDNGKQPPALHLVVEGDEQALFECPICNEPGTVLEATERSWRHLNFFQYHAYITAKLPRIRCLSHDVQSAKVRWASNDSAFTHLYEDDAVARIRRRGALQEARPRGMPQLCPPQRAVAETSKPRYFWNRWLAQSLDAGYPECGEIEFLWDYTSRQIRELQPKADGTPAFIYVKADRIGLFFEQYARDLPFPYVLVSGDEDISPGCLVSAQTLDECQHLVAWWAQNLDIRHPKAFWLPLGMDFHTMYRSEVFWGPRADPLAQNDVIHDRAEQALPFQARQFAILAQFNLSHPERAESLRVLKGNAVPLIQLPQTPRADTLAAYGKCQFVLSPHGNGYDSHRTYEALALGCMVVMKRNAISDHLTRHFSNIILVEDYAQVDRDFLEQAAREHVQHQQDSLFLSYWRLKIRKSDKKSVSGMDINA